MSFNALIVSGNRVRTTAGTFEEFEAMVLCWQLFGCPKLTPPIDLTLLPEPRPTVLSFPGFSYVAHRVSHVGGSG